MAALLIAATIGLATIGWNSTSAHTPLIERAAHWEYGHPIVSASLDTDADGVQNNHLFWVTNHRFTVASASVDGGRVRIVNQERQVIFRVRLMALTAGDLRVNSDDDDSNNVTLFCDLSESDREDFLAALNGADDARELAGLWLAIHDAEDVVCAPSDSTASTAGS